LEFQGEISRFRHLDTRLGYGAGDSFDLELRTDRAFTPNDTWTVDVSYVLVSPFPGISPGLAVGAQDLFDRTGDGRRFFVVSTFRFDVEALDGDAIGELTLGGYFGRSSSVFVGINVPLAAKLRVLAELDGIRPYGGIELRPAPNVYARFYLRDNLPVLALGAQF
jgi:hypothetical protein